MPVYTHNWFCFLEKQEQEKESLSCSIFNSKIFLKWMMLYKQRQKLI